MYSDEMSRVKRPYNSPIREAQARRTRERIVDAARQLWAERGFAVVTMEEIATEADVAVQTVYGTFGSKGGILTALLGRLEEQAGLEELIGALRAAPTPQEQLRLVAAFNRRLFEQGADIIAIVRGWTAADPDVAAWMDEGDRRRREGQAPLIANWHAAGAFRPEIDPSEAGDVLHALTSPELYLLLVNTSGWTADRYETWLNQTLHVLLFGNNEQA
jgi:TetR/AcrR family transcriptional regulator, regulator of cefoperazone and chloramphenicol sensitivity